MPLSKIVLPVDFSERAVCAGHYARALHDRFGSQVTVLHVLPPPHYEFGAMEVGGSVLEDLYRQRSEQAQRDLTAFLAEELSPEFTERAIVEGDPAHKIVDAAHDRGAGLIVMPTHGYGTFRRFILGSVTAKVLHDADCPVWTGVHMAVPCATDVHFRHVVAALDLGQQTERTLMWASRFAQSSGAQLSLIHAMPDLEGKAGEYFDPEWRVHVEKAVRDEVEGLQARLGTNAPLTVSTGEPAETVCGLAKGLAADVLVIGRGSASGLLGRLRANAYSIIRQSECPVVSV
jgi:nucleotide-binding universal stress UspA family protein